MLTDLLLQGSSGDGFGLRMLFNPAVVWVLIPITAILGGFWVKVSKVRSENELKRAMVEQGMSAEEIERVLKAK